MPKIHLVMQGKGGVGKSLLAFFLAQYVKEKTGKCLVFDTDPLNQTLARTTALETKVVRILADDHITILKNAFDLMIEECEAEDADVVSFTTWARPSRSSASCSGSSAYSPRTPGRLSFRFTSDRMMIGRVLDGSATSFFKASRSSTVVTLLGRQVMGTQSRIPIRFRAYRTTPGTVWAAGI